MSYYRMIALSWLFVRLVKKINGRVKLTEDILKQENDVSF